MTEEVVLSELGAVGVRAEVLVVPTKGGEVRLRVEVTESGGLYICSEVARGEKDELLSMGVVAVATGLAESLGMRPRPLMRTLHLRDSPVGNHYLNVPDAVEIKTGERAEEYIAILKQFLSGLAR